MSRLPEAIFMPKRPVPTSDLRVSDVINAAPAVRELTVRTVAPALVIVLEAEAPPRMLHSEWSDAEFKALLAAISNDPASRTMLSVYFADRADESGDEDL